MKCRTALKALRQPGYPKSDRISASSINPAYIAGFFLFQYPGFHSHESGDSPLKKLYISNLAHEASEESVREIFSEYGTVRSIQVAKDIFTGQCRGFGFIEMEGHEARAAISGLDGKFFKGKNLRVRFAEPKGKHGGRRR